MTGENGIVRVAGHIAILAAVANAHVLAQSPPLDPSFASGGTAVVRALESFGTPTLDVVPHVDGSVLVLERPNGSEVFLHRFDRHGVRDGAYGYGEAGILGKPAALAIGRPVVRPDGSAFVPVALGLPYNTVVSVLKLGPDGKRDAAYGANGLAYVRGQPAFSVGDFDPAGIAVEPDGRAVVALRTRWQQIVLHRFLPSGEADESFGPAGRRVLALGGQTAPFQAGPDGSFALLHTAPGTDGIGVVRFRPGGEYDEAFGPWQTVGDFDIVQAVFAGATAIDGVGHLTIIVDVFAEGRYSCRCLVVERRDRAGALVTSFGAGGRLRMPLPWSSAGSAFLALEPDGSLSFVEPLDGQTSAIHRLDRFANPEARFSNGGVAWVRETPSLIVHGLALGPADTLYVAGGVQKAEPVWLDLPLPWDLRLYRLRPTFDPGTQPAELTVAEYFHAGFGHYFLTPNAAEQAALAAMPEWRQTGHTFRAWSSHAPWARPVCRFFSKGTFAPKFTHFFTHVEQECESLRASPLWRDEGAHFGVRSTERKADGSFACPTGTTPLYRAYNNGQGGAPNHRYTTDPGVIGRMVQEGSVPEGAGANGLFACVPER